MAVRETLLSLLVRVRVHGRRATTITPFATKQFQCWRNHITPHPMFHFSSNEGVVGCNPIVYPVRMVSDYVNLIVYLNSNEEGLALDPVVYPSSYEEGRTSTPVVSGFC